MGQTAYSIAMQQMKDMIAKANLGEVALEGVYEQLAETVTGIYNAVAKYGADPTGVEDSSGAIQAAADAAYEAGGGTVYLPAGDYKLLSGVELLSRVCIDMSMGVRLIFTLPNATDIGFKINSTDQCVYRFSRISSTNGNGTALQVLDCNFNRVYFSTIQGFTSGIGLHLLGQGNQVLDNTFEFNLITQCQTGIKLETLSPVNSMEGNLFLFNFITETRDGIHMKDLIGGKMLFNEFKGTAIHCTITSGVALYFEGFITNQTFEIKGFIDSDLGNLIAGNYTVAGETDFAHISTITFRLFIAHDTAKVKYAGRNVYIENYNLRYSHLYNETGYVPSDTPNAEASFNGGLPVFNNFPLFTVNAPAASAGTEHYVFAYHQFLTHDSPRTYAVIPATGNTEKFAITAIDNSYVNKREMAFKIKYLVTTSGAESISFYVAVN